MKILQITNKVPYPETDGGAIACMNVLRGLHSDGHEITLLSMVTNKHPISISDIPSEIKGLAEIKLVNVPAPINAWDALINLLFSKIPYNAERFIDKSFSNELREIIKKNEFDIVQLEGLYVCPYIPVIRKISNAKIVYRSHNIEHEIWERTACVSKGFKKWYLNNLSKRIKRFEISLLNSYDLVVPITKRDGDILNHLGNNKPMHVSQTGFDLSSLTQEKEEIEAASVFHIGALDWAPNQEGIVWFLNNCWPEILKYKPETKFYVAGRNAPDWFVSKISGKNVFYEGEVEDAYRFMNSKALMVVPLLSGSGMRIKIVEGMALGKPIVSTSIGSEGIHTTSGKNILIADEAKDFSAGILQLLDNKKLFESLSASASLFIHENFNNLVLTEKLAEFYKKHLE